MTEGFIRHFISFLGMLILAVVFFAGYKSGMLGWWWAAFFLIITYFIIYKLLGVEE